MPRACALLLSTVLLAATTAAAQTSWHLGLRGGANRAATMMTEPDVEPSFNPDRKYFIEDKALYAWQAGLVAEARWGNLALQPALLFSQKGAKGTAGESVNGVAGRTYITTRSANRYNWLELPVNVVYTLHGDHGLQVFGGAYAAIAVGGRQRGTRTYTQTFGWEPVRSEPQDHNAKITYGPKAPNRRADAGLNAGVGCRQGPWQVQAGYSLGLVNRRRDSAELGAYNRVAQLTATYFWGKVE